MAVREMPFDILSFDRKEGAIVPIHRKTDSSSFSKTIPFDVCAAKTTGPEGKPGTTVLNHCQYVGIVAQELVTHLHPSLHHLLTTNPGLAAALHDVGKVSPGYQNKYFRDTLVQKYSPEMPLLGFETKHAAISAAAIDRWLGRKETAVARAAGVHHGSGERSYAPDTAETLGGMAWAGERRKLIEQLVGSFGQPPVGWTMQADPRPNLLAGLATVADWIGSDELFFPSDGPPVVDGDPFATARRALEACGFKMPPIRPGLTFQEVFGFPPRREQEAFFETVAGPGLYVLEAPMGCGKTEAALYAAYRLISESHHTGLYFALPTRLTSDRIHQRVSDFLAHIAVGDQPAPLLAHGMAWLKAYEHGGADTAPGNAWFHPLKRALLFPYAVGTVDQALLGVLNVRHSFVRLFGLAGKVVILDEVHSYDMYTGTLLDRLVEALQSLGCTVIILSATLTTARRNALAPALCSISTEAYPLVCGVPADNVSFATPLPAPQDRFCKIRIEPWSDIQVAVAAIEAARSGQCVVCIANTVARAQSWFRTIRSDLQQHTFPVGILHARVPLFRREEIEALWLASLGKNGKRPQGCILIATQILEQSVDLDADLMISEIAPSDMLLQRMGRVWRHDRKMRPCSAAEFLVVANDLTGVAEKDAVLEVLGKENCCIYSPYVLMRTYEVWRNLGIVGIPRDVRHLVEATYADLKDESALMVALKDDLNRKREKLRRRALTGQEDSGLPVGSDTEDAATRYSDIPTIQVLLAETIDAGDRDDCARITLVDGTTHSLDAFRSDFEATRALHRNLVTITRYLVPSRQKAFWLTKHFHEQPTVLVRNQEDGSLEMLDGTPTALCYSPEYGVYKSSVTGTVPVIFREDGGPNPFDDQRFDW
jgi:CRISPR-associated endonuclease/helicase Cas3